MRTPLVAYIPELRNLSLFQDGMLFIKIWRYNSATVDINVLFRVHLTDESTTKDLGIPISIAAAVAIYSHCGGYHCYSNSCVCNEETRYIRRYGNEETR